MLDAIDDEELAGASLRVEPEPQLLRQYGEDRGENASVVGIGLTRRRRRHDDLCRELEVAVEISREPSAVNNRPAEKSMRPQTEFLHGHPADRLVGAARAELKIRRRSEVP